MKIAYTRNKIGAEDITWGLGTEQQTRVGETKPVSQVNSSHIPYNDIKTVEEILTGILNGSIGGGGGQLLGANIVRGIQYMSQYTDENIVIGASQMPDGKPINAFAVESLTIENGGSITIEDGCTFKIL